MVKGVAGTKVRYVIEEIDGRFIGIGMNGRELYCNTIPLPSRAEAEADLRATCYSAWGDSVDLSPEYYIPRADDIARYISKLFSGLDPEPMYVKLARHPREKFWGALLLISAIPRGRVTTYGELARALGTSPRAAGNYASRNPFPLIVPCHRVIRSDMRIGGYSYGPIVKASILMAEGIRVEFDTGKVDPSKVVRAEDLMRLRRVLGVVGYE